MTTEEVYALIPPVIHNLRRSKNIPEYEYSDMYGSAALALVSVIDKIDKNRADEETKSYLCKIIRYAAVDYLRDQDPLGRKERQKVKAGRAEDVKITSLSPTIPEKFTIDDEIVHEQFRKVIINVPMPKSYKPLLNAILNGETPAETSQRTGIPAQRLQNYRHRLVAVLRKYMIMNNFKYKDFAY